MSLCHQFSTFPVHEGSSDAMDDDINKYDF